jgi:hypothetical protein
MGNISDKSVEKGKAYILFSVAFFRKSAFCEKVEKYTRVRLATGARALHTGYLNLQWLRQYTSMLRLYIYCLSFCNNDCRIHKHKTILIYS